MKKANKYIHIGFPKGFSTSLQRNFFSSHPDIIHLGTGTSDNNIGYVDSDIERILEVYLKYAKHSYYQKKKNEIIAYFKNWFDKIENQNTIKYIGISSEHLSFNFTSDGLSNYEKAIRLKEIFGKHTKIIIVIRNQKALIESLYKESIRVGYYKTFKEYLTDLYQFKERNFFYDFCFNEVLELYQNLFGKNNVGIFFFEKYKRLNNTNTKKLVEDIGTFLNLEFKTKELAHFNKALNLFELEKKRKLNKENRHELGNSIYSGVEKHRLKKYWEIDLNINYPEYKIYKDVIIKRKLIAQSIGANGKPLDLSYPIEIKKQIFSIYKNQI